MTDYRQRDLANRLRALARSVEAGHYRLPVPGVGPDSATRRVVADAVHDLTCGWQTSTRVDLHGADCGGCGRTVITLPHPGRRS